MVGPPANMSAKSMWATVQVGRRVIEFLPAGAHREIDRPEQRLEDLERSGAWIRSDGWLVSIE